MHLCILLRGKQIVLLHGLQHQGIGPQTLDVYYINK